MFLLAAAALWFCAACSDGGETSLPPDNEFPPRLARFEASGISFESDRVVDGNTQLYVVDLEGGEPRQLVNLSGARVGGHAWTLDGASLLFIGGGDDITSPGAVFVSDASGGASEPILEAPVNAPAWSPGGDRIAFIRWEDSGADIFVVRADGSAEVRVTSHPDADFYAFFIIEHDPWSFDGRLLGFERTSDRRERAVFAARSDGSQVWLVAEDATFGGWSPTSERIALLRFVEFSEGDAGGTTLLTTDARGEDVLVAAERAWAPTLPIRWSPEGDRLLFVHQATEGARHNSTLAVVDLAGGEPRDITVDGRCDGEFGAEWSPDGAEIVFTRGCDFERVEIWLVSSEGGDERLLVTAPAFFPRWAPVD